MRPSRKPRVILMILIALCGLFIYSYAMRLVEKSQVESEIVAMRSKIDAAKTEQYELTDELQGLTDDDYIDRIAREYFDYAKPGDKLLVIVDDQNRASPAAVAVAQAVANPIDVRNFPVWQQWVVFFTSEKITFALQ